MLINCQEMGNLILHTRLLGTAHQQDKRCVWLPSPTSPQALQSLLLSAWPHSFSFSRTPASCGARAAEPAGTRAYVAENQEAVFFIIVLSQNALIWESGAPEFPALGWPLPGLEPTGMLHT